MKIYGIGIPKLPGFMDPTCDLTMGFRRCPVSYIYITYSLITGES